MWLNFVGTLICLFIYSIISWMVWGYVAAVIVMPIMTVLLLIGLYLLWGSK